MSNAAGLVKFPTRRGTAAGYLALPRESRQPAPGVLVLHAWWGLTGVVRDVCDLLAAEGFVALAPDLFGGSTAHTVEQAESLRRRASGISYAVVGAADHLGSFPSTRGRPLGVVGFSMGAHWAMWLVTQQILPLQVNPSAVVLFYGVRGGALASTSAAYQVHLAEQDPYVSASATKRFQQALRASGRPGEVHVYPDTGHWFFEADRPEAYVPEAAALAWERTLAFLQARLATAGDL